MEKGAVRRNLMIMAVTWAIMNPFGTATRVYASLYYLELGAGPVEVGLISLAGFVTVAFSRLIGGYLADSVGRKKIIVPMTVVYGLASLLYAVATDWTWILIASILSSLALLYQPAIQAILADTLPPEVRGRGLSAANTVAQIASLAGPPLATLMVSKMSLEPAMRLLYTLHAGSIFLAGLIRIGFVETLQERSKPSFRSAVREYMTALKELKGDLGKFLLLSSAATALYQTAFPYIQIYAVKDLGISEEFWGLISTVTSVESVISTLISGYLTDKMGRNLSLALGYASGACGLAILALAPPNSPLVVLLSQVVAVAFISWPARFALFADLTSVRSRGKLTAIMGLIRGNLSGAASALGGVLYEAGPKLTFGLTALALVPVALLSAVWLPHGVRVRERMADVKD